MISPSHPIDTDGRTRICPSIETLSDLLDKSAPLPRRLVLHRHVKSCAHCTGALVAEARLRDAAKGIGAYAVAPKTLHVRLRAQIAVAPRFSLSPLAPRRAPALLVVAGFGALTLLVALLLRPVFTPLPAYAQVVQAMRTVRTARWLETSTEYDAATQKTLRFTMRKEARLDPPALSTTFDFSRPYKQIVTPKRTFVKQKEGAQMVTGPSFSPLNSPEAGTSASATLRQRILDKLTAPEEMGNGPVHWRSAKERVDGRDLVRFILGIGPGSDKKFDEQTRLTRPGSRHRLWVDPNTLRVVKSESDYYDGQKYSRTVGANYEYDVPLPDSTFAER